MDEYQQNATGAERSLTTIFLTFRKRFTQRPQRSGIKNVSFIYVERKAVRIIKSVVMTDMKVLFTAESW